MKSTPVEHPHSFTSSLLTRPPIPTANQNSGSTSRRDHSEFWGLYKPAQTYPRQDLTATHSRDNISGSGLSSPALQQPSTKPFSGLPARRMTSHHREAGEAVRERPGIVYPLLPCATRPDTRLLIDAALPESAALDRRSRPPTVLNIGGTSLQENHQLQGPRLARRQNRNCSTGVYRPSKRSPPQGPGVNKIRHNIKKKTVTGYKQKGHFDTTPPGIIPGTAGSPLRVRAAPPCYWTWRYTTWNYRGNSWLPARGLGRYTSGIVQDVIPPGISPSTKGERSPDYSLVPPSISAVLF